MEREESFFTEAEIWKMTIPLFDHPGEHYV